MITDLQLNKEIYSLHDIMTAKIAYDSLCRITIHDEGNVWRLTFSECTYEAVLTMKEFENYLIDLMNSGKRNDC